LFRMKLFSFQAVIFHESITSFPLLLLYIYSLSLKFQFRAIVRVRTPSKLFVIETVYCSDLSVFVIHEILKRLINFI